MPSSDFVSPIMAGLMDHRVSAQIKDLDHYRIHGGMAVETDYIVHVSCVNTGTKSRPEPDFDGFIISKTFSAFRTLIDQLHDAADAFMSTNSHEQLPPDTKQKVKKLAQYCEVVMQLIDSQRTQYLGKVNYMYVKVLSKQRSQVITDVLEATLSNFPSDIDSHPFLNEVAKRIENFFLTDHCASVDEEGEDSNVSSLFITPIKKNYQHVDNKITASVKKPVDSPDSGIVDNHPPPPNLDRAVSSPVVPYTRKKRRSRQIRDLDEKELKNSGSRASLLLDDDRSQTDMVPSYDAPVPTVSVPGASALGVFMDNNPIMFMGLFAALTQVVRLAGERVVSLDMDILLLVVFAAFCLGLNTPRPLVGGVDKPPLRGRRRRRKAGQPPTPTNAAKLLRRSMMISTPRSISTGNRNISFSAETIEEDEAEAEMEEEEDDVVIRSPMPRFPEGAEMGSINNCFSESPYENFKVRGDNYLSDKKKVKSGPCLFPCRGVDLFLTDTCPENVGRISGIMGGQLRDVPTFLINFRLPWGVLLFYYEIPERFVPFVACCYGNGSAADKAKLEEKINSMNNQDRCCARWLLGDHEHKDQTLKIFPVVVEGPWVVKSIVGGKPAIIGTKLPVSYVYGKPGTAPDGSKQALYLEADLDIVSSSAARGILSAVRTYTQDITLDLGFAIQGNSNDELRENMLVATRLHGIDPLNAPPLPPTKDLIMTGNDNDDGDDDTES
ncbi:ENHANCED DISEASE RESISTANCE 2 [Seminavis robusta]|uniref:ENHANCED DISEASE RESISTANCE 2 n=1 Tax=Seminavis robusta TaxID=568900 RepID=A0A9N8DAC8_9STRA|nr:ENHANCED DISEASE RESISTANCE 2 [Seminavis robusta]|eukprot:Sro63_g036000.1 ENHANCED DISEASE RESISTANCE 2 (723) ;mRNA; r:108733-111204